MALRGPRTLRLLFGLAVAGAACTLFAAARPLAADVAAGRDRVADLARTRRCTGDNNDGIVAAFAKQGRTVTGCGDAQVKQLCATNAAVQSACPCTCPATAPATTTPPAACTKDDDAGFVALYQKQTGEALSGCIDAPSCANSKIRALCCKTCAGASDGNNNGPPQDLPAPDDSDPVHIYLNAGQSNCKGSADVDMMAADGKHPELFEADTSKSNAWFAGITNRGKADSSFKITALRAGAEGDKMGPEIAIGHRLQELTGKRVLMFKYCLGGTNVDKDWNPDYRFNVWDKTKDDNSAAFLEPLLKNDNPKWQQYLQFNYHLRLMREQLDATGVKYEFKGLFWRQGSADKTKLDWKTYGARTIRLFSAIRAEVNTPGMPVIDEANQLTPNIQSGKAYAAKVLCDVTVAGVASAGQDPSSTCIVGPSNSCLEDLHIDPAMFNQFGWDTGMPDSMKPAGFSSKTSKWFKRFEADPAVSPDLHDQYDAIVWTGRAMAHALVREHTAYTVPLGFSEWDLWAKWPVGRCTKDAPWSAAESSPNYCWEDESAGCADPALGTDGATDCSGVTADSCRSTPAHYENCPCSCLAKATCSDEPAPVDFTAEPTASTTAAAAGSAPATTAGTTSVGQRQSTAVTTAAATGSKATTKAAPPSPPSSAGGASSSTANPSGSTGNNQSTACAAKACGAECSTCTGGICPAVMEYCQPDRTCGTNSQPQCAAAESCAGSRRRGRRTIILAAGAALAVAAMGC